MNSEPLGSTNAVPESGAPAPEQKAIIPSASIIIPAWGKAPETAAYLTKAVASIVEHVRMPYEVILVDNASPCWDNYPLEWLSHNSIPWTLIRFHENRGFGPAVNAGSRLAKGEFICQMNSDCELVEDSVSLLIDAMDRNSIDLGTVEHLQNCQHYGLGKSDDVMGEDWFFGAFWICRRFVWEHVGGFDEGYILGYWEDSDLIKRVRGYGYKVAGHRSTWVGHKGGASAHPDRDKYFELNRQRYEARWGKK